MPSQIRRTLAYLLQIPQHLLTGSPHALVLIPVLVFGWMNTFLEQGRELNTQTLSSNGRDDTDRHLQRLPG